MNGKFSYVHCFDSFSTLLAVRMTLKKRRKQAWSSADVNCHKACHLLGDLREKSFKIALWPKGSFVQPAKTGTVTWELLVVMFFPLNEV